MTNLPTKFQDCRSKHSTDKLQWMDRWTYTNFTTMDGQMDICKFYYNGWTDGHMQILLKGILTYLI